MRWEWHGCCDCAHWLNWQCGIGKVAAREKVRVARALGDLPQISESFAKGELSYSKVRAMTRIATPENEADLLNVALHGTAAHMEKLVRQYRWVERIEDAQQALEQHQQRYLRFSYDDDGSFLLEARLPPEVGAMLKQAIEAAEEVLYQEDREAEQAAQAAVLHNDVSAETQCRRILIMSGFCKVEMSAFPRSDKLPRSFLKTRGYQDADSGVSDDECRGTGPIDGDRTRPREAIKPG